MKCDIGKLGLFLSSRKFNEIEAFGRRRRRAVLTNVSSKKFQGIERLHQMTVACSSAQFLMTAEAKISEWVVVFVEKH